MAERAPLTNEQLLEVLSTVASAAATLAEFSATVADREDWSEIDLHVIHAMAERIGMVADAACGERIIGDPMRWACGPAYADAARAA
jgi:hypothetical protein